MLTFNTKVDQLDPAHPAVTPLPYAEAAVRQIVGEAIGYGSTCWHGGTGDAVFDDQAARVGVEAAVTALLDVTGLGTPALGCATTAELRSELATRDRLGKPHADDNYRTVDDA